MNQVQRELRLPPGAVDAHHHIWRLDDLPWLAGPTVPRIFGPYEAIRRDYLIDEYRDEATSSGVAKSVYLQTNWPPERSYDEVAWAQGVAAESGWPHAIVGSADMFDSSCPATFERQAKHAPLLRGMRLQLHWHQVELYRFARGPQAMADSIFRQNLALLPQYDWLFELQVFGPQMNDAARLVADHPETTFVLVHGGMLESLDPATVSTWQLGMSELAQRDNVVVKLSGLGTFTRRIDRDVLRIVVETSLDLFGADRCMWGSNFPVEKLWTDYKSLVGAYLAELERYDEDTRKAVFRTTAERVYGLGNSHES